MIWYYIVILSCISLMTDDIKYHFMYLLSCLYTLPGEVSIQILCQVLNRLSFQQVMSIPYICWIQVLYTIYDLQLFSSITWGVFLLFNGKINILIKSNLSTSFFYSYVLFCFFLLKAFLGMKALRF